MKVMRCAVRVTRAVRCEGDAVRCEGDVYAVRVTQRVTFRAT